MGDSRTLWDAGLSGLCGVCAQSCPTDTVRSILKGMWDEERSSSSWKDHLHVEMTPANPGRATQPEDGRLLPCPLATKPIVPAASSVAHFQFPKETLTQEGSSMYKKPHSGGHSISPFSSVFLFACRPEGCLVIIFIFFKSHPAFWCRGACRIHTQQGGGQMMQWD